jgi:hypothetical protein
MDLSESFSPHNQFELNDGFSGYLVCIGPVCIDNDGSAAHSDIEAS